MNLQASFRMRKRLFHLSETPSFSARQNRHLKTSEMKKGGTRQ
ncbi:hypothetical protein I656_02919 [Geobacillus sp. WSUCF1]|nr:hypothetical protein I656_02919 [Geobacillus sp. WSUCF1]